MTAISETDSTYAWSRLGICLLLSTIGGVGMWSLAVAIPSLQAEYGALRGQVSLAYTGTMLGFGVGGILLGRLADAKGIVPSLMLGALALGLGFLAAASAPNLWLFGAAHAALIGFGTAATFGPLVADISHWFLKRRGIAVAICASGNYLAGAIWPPVIEHFIRDVGWRETYFGVGVFCLATSLPLSLALRRRMRTHAEAVRAASAATPESALGLSGGRLQALIAVAGVACCVAMSMPQVHIVAYCVDLGYGVARGAEMLAIMLALGIVSRVGSGWIADRIGGLKTLLLGSILQGTSLAFYLGFDGLMSLYLISALFGLVQGGIVPSYAIIVREYFPAAEAGTRVGIAIFATLIGMALGGWMAGEIFDLTGNYRLAFLNGVLWNLLNGAVAYWLIRLATHRRQLAVQAG
jgi:MFS family permease